MSSSANKWLGLTFCLISIWLNNTVALLWGMYFFTTANITELKDLIETKKKK